MVSSFCWQNEIEKNKAESIGKDYILFEGPLLTSAFDYPLKLNTTLVINCTHGTFKGKVNLKPYHEKGPFILIIMAGQIIQYEHFSNDFSAYFTIMSDRFLENLFMTQQESARLFLSVKDNSLVRLSKEDSDIIINYQKLIKATIRNKNNPHRMQIVQHLNQALFYGIGYRYHKIADKERKTKNEVLVKKFLESVNAHYNEERKMEFYANKLFLTPKYLSKVIKETSGKSGNEWINNFVILESKALLKSTNLSIQQISDKLNFPSQSNFGRYFNRHTGVSPKKYRAKQT